MQPCCTSTTAQVADFCLSQPTVSTAPVQFAGSGGGSSFGGCGGLGSWDVTNIEFKNGDAQQSMCIARLELLV